MVERAASALWLAALFVIAGPCYATEIVGIALNSGTHLASTYIDKKVIQLGSNSADSPGFLQ